jgi:hypothetical protein
MADAPPINSEAQILADFTRDFKRLQRQKARPDGGVELRTLLNVAMELGEHYATVKNQTLAFAPEAGEDNKLHLVFNVVARRMSRLIGRLCAIGGIYRSTPNSKDAKALTQSEVVDALIKALDQKLVQPDRDRELYSWLLKGGTAFEKVAWIPNVTLDVMPQFSEQPGPDGRPELMYRDLVMSEGQPEPGVIVPASIVKQLTAQGRAPESFEIYEIVKEVGEVGSEILGPLNMFIDQSVRSVEDLAPDQAIYEAKFRTQGWIRENYGDEMVDGDPEKQIAPLSPDHDLQIVTTQFVQPDGGVGVAGVSLKNMIPMIQGSVTPEDPPMNLVLERYQPFSKTWPHGRFTVFVPGKRILFDGPNPYGEIPYVDFHFEPVTVDFWTKDYVTDQIAPQRFLNKRISQLGEQANGSIYDKILLGGSLTPADIPADYPGYVVGGLAENGQPLVSRLAGPSLPQWFLESISLSLKLEDDIAGGQELTQHSQFPGQLRGPMAVPLMQEILDTAWGPLYQHIGARTARVKQMRVNRVKQFYPAVRTLHYTGRDSRDEVFEFHTDKVLPAGVDYTVSVERSSLLPELRALREARVRERLQSPLSILYMDERTGRLDRSKIAQDLNYGDLGRESREAQYHKLGAEIVSRLRKAEPVPPVLPFWDHAAMMDELEAAMATTEFLESSQQVQALFFGRWNEHNAILQQQAQQQMQAQQSQMVQASVAQATQQAAAEAAAEAVHMAFQQVQQQAAQASATNLPADLANKIAATAGQNPAPTMPQQAPPAGLPPGFQG